MSKLWMIGIGVMALSVAGAMAEGEAKQEAPAVDKPKHERKAEQVKAELKELSLEGVIQKIEHKRKDGQIATSLTLLTDDGTKVMLPKAGTGKAVPAVDLENMVGARVKIVGMGYEMERGGKKRCAIKTIKSFEKVVPVTAPVPAPAAAPAP
jgi:hypothetical protein